MDDHDGTETKNENMLWAWSQMSTENKISYQEVLPYLSKNIPWKVLSKTFNNQIDGFLQGCSNSRAFEMESLQFYT